MNRYQHKRVIGSLRRTDRLNEFELKFLESIKDTPVIRWPAFDELPLSDKQNHVLNQIAARVRG